MTERKAVRDPFAVATAQAQEQGYTDFSEGSEGDKKRDEIAEAIKTDDKMAWKQVSEGLDLIFAALTREEGKTVLKRLNRLAKALS